ncbi:hypothetical protein LTR78_000502 [Recurvomyces mirabilis]|uniref:Uncharacterized protein n=1 Tax=Recurvomyces mirabilis TaxID=574656 RepID=A0AAE0WYG6_9PEZI|nr:hypothetical protein LTR78_000502 [Recurvomyces mirabilis]KAK5162157.1 hypothetical protein LTS14_000503 [Recurvomyces mirabilis]
MGPTASANVGTISDGGSALFTSITSALSSACPAPTSGSTLTSCSSSAKVTGLTYVDTYEIYRDGTLDIDIPLISVSDPTVLSALIAFVAAGVRANTQSPNNTASTWYDCDKSQFPVCLDDGGIDPWTTNLTNVPSLYQALYLEQTVATGGAVKIQNIEVKMQLEAGADDFACSDTGLALSILAGVASVLPGLGWLSGGTVGSVARAGLSLACNLPHLKE